MSEEITLVDLNDEVIGYGTKEEVHRSGQLHRAFSVFIINEGRMLLQKRSLSKYHSGGLWSNACCSHQRKGEVLSEAVHRRMQEELGFDCDLEEQFTFIYRTCFENGIIEYELDHVFVGSCDPQICADPEEVSETRWVGFDELKAEMLEHPQRFSSWFIIAAPKVMDIQKMEIMNECS